MARIYKSSDRISVKIDDVVVKLAPLSLSQKVEIAQLLASGRARGDLREVTKGLTDAIRFSLKSIEGIEDSDGQPYKLALEDNQLTDECLNELMNLDINKKLTLVCSVLVNGVPKKFTDDDNAPLDGVEFVSVEKETEQKKS